MLSLIAQTATALTDPQKTGVDQIDRVIGIVLSAFAALSLFVAAANRLKVQADVLAGQVAQLFGSTKAVVTGVEVSRRDIADVLAAEIPSLPTYRVDEIANRIHDRLTARIQQVSTAARVEPVLAPIVKETKSALRAVTADGAPVPTPEAPR